MLKVVTLLVLLVCTVVGARSCNSSGSGSVLNPRNVLGNGLSGVCANQQAVVSASGDITSGTVLPPSAEGQLNSALGVLGQKGSGPLSCPTTTTGGG
jgi:hypothetical protein